jgi:biotin transporter BioY
MWSYKKLNMPSNRWLRIIVLVVIGNIPMYLLMWKKYEGKMSLPETKIFLSGYLTIPIVYGFLYRRHQNEKFIQKT